MLTLQKYFDVDTDDVVRRLNLAVNPIRMEPFITNTADTVEGDKRPDLWGPFWIYQTTVFAQFFATSIGSFLLSLGSEHHQYDIVTFAASATVLAIFTFAVPFGVWLVIQYLNLVPTFSLIQSVSLYGYSMAIWSPLVVIGGLLVPVLPHTPGLVIKFVLLGIGFLISTKFLLMNLRGIMFNASSEVNKSTATLVLLACGIVQAAFVAVLSTLH